MRPCDDRDRAAALVLCLRLLGCCLLGLVAPEVLSGMRDSHPSDSLAVFARQQRPLGVALALAMLVSRMAIWPLEVVRMDLKVVRHLQGGQMVIVKSPSFLRAFRV